MKKILLFSAFIISLGTQSFAQCGTGITGTLNSCAANCNDSVTFTSTAGTPPYNLVVTGGPSVQYASSYTWVNACPGSYHYDITDATMSCHDTGTVTITGIPITPSPALTVEAYDMLGNPQGNNPVTCELQTIDFFIEPPFINILPNTFTWKKNGVPVLVQNNVANYLSANWQTPSLATGDIITLEVSWPNACMSPNPCVSQNIQFTVIPNQPPVVTVSHNFPSDSICRGNAVTFTANTFEAGTPTYDWYLNGTPVGNASSYTTSSTLLSGYYHVFCIITSDEYCDTQDPVFNPTVTSSPIDIYIDPCYYYVPSSGNLGPYATCGTAFYDSQLDLPVNYSNNANGLVKFCPAVVGQYAIITFTSLNLADAGDRLRIFSSTPSSMLTADTSTVPLLNIAGPTNNSPGPVTSNLFGGCLTAHFRSNGAGNAAGWVANVTCTPSLWSSIQGMVYVDANINCIWDSGETPAASVPLHLSLNNILLGTTYTYSTGHYTFYATDSTYSLELSPNLADYGYSTSCPSTGQLNVLSLPSSGNNFAVQCNPGFDLIATLNTNAFRPGFTSNIYPSVQSFNCQAINGHAQLILPPNISFSSASYPHTVSGDTITWNFSVLNSSINLGFVSVVTSLSANIGDSVFVKFMVEPTAGDSVPENNIVIGSGIVTNSYDPNDKAVIPAGPVLPSSWLTYTVRFQNTGTDTAFNISIVDTLDSNLDLYTFQPLATSHPYDIVMLDSNVVKFVFSNIMLADSNVNEPLSHGWITYRVKSLPGLPNATVINNTAYIYFDFNPAVVTNTTVTVIDIPTSVQEQNNTAGSMVVSPNPVANQFTMYDVRFTIEKIEIYNILGEKVFSEQVTGNPTQVTVNTSTFPSGIYFVKVNGEKAEHTAKFIKQ